MTDENVQNINEESETPETVSVRKKLLIFWMRMIGWLVVGVATPITTFSIKFGLFTEYGYKLTTDELGNVTGMNIALNGWGIISVLLIVFTLMTILNQIIEAYSKRYSMTKQVLVGIKRRIIPIAIVLAICYLLKNCLDQTIFCLWVLGITQIVAIPLNPLPQWVSEKKGEENYNDLISGAVQFFKDYKASKKKGDK